MTDGRLRYTATRLLRVVVGATLAVSVLVLQAPAKPAAALASPVQSLRAQYHLTPPDNWLSDPQRPIYVNGKYNFYYLYSDRTSSTGQGGWRHVTTTDNVVFADQGIAIPQGPNFPVWTGSSVVDTGNTAGFGAGAVIAVATQPTNDDPASQEQYLYYSTDGGATFTPYGPPVIANPNPGHDDWFRDPKIAWDAANSRWVAVIAGDQHMDFYTSPDLKNWTYQSTFTYSAAGVNGFECPDFFQIKADDGTTHWVLAGSVRGNNGTIPGTYAYWTGTWNGTQFTSDDTDPQYLDYGWDWYAAVTWPDAASPLDTRYGIGWMNNWRYAGDTGHFPADASDNASGQMSIVRQIQLAANGNGSYSLLSQPVPALDNIVTNTVDVPDATVNGAQDLSYHGSAYELDTDVSWTSLNNVGISVGVNADHTRYTNIGVYQGNLYVDRSHSDQTGQSPDISFSPYLQTNAPVGALTSAHLKILVDRSSVEVYLDNGKTVSSNLVFFKPGDDGIQLYTAGGSATFANTTIKEFRNVTTAAAPSSPYQDFEGSTYGSWTTTGTAFGSGPAQGTLPNQQPVTGYLGNGLVNSYLSGDSSTGTLSSSDFTITKPLIDFLVGGGQHPKPSDLFADFEGTTWGTGWAATGSFSGEGPTAESLPNQVGAKVLDTFVNGGDSSTGTISSPQFTITRDYIDFLIAGGNHPWGASGATVVNLIVDGVVQRTATGNNSGTMAPVGWDVHSLIGHTAQIQVVDNATGTWGHVMADQILFTNGPGATAGEPDVQTTVNLVVGGTVVRTTTGQNNEHLTAASWLVNDLIGQTAHIEIIDNNAGGWGHINADQFTFDQLPLAPHSAPIAWNATDNCVDRDVASGKVQIWTCSGLGNQNWSLHSDGTITNDDICLELPAGQTANHTLVQVAKCDGSAAQTWTDTGSALVNEAANRCLDLDSGDATPGKQLQVYDCVGGVNQTWTLPNT